MPGARFRDDAVVAQTRDLPADRLDREAEQIGHVLAAERQFEAKRSIALVAGVALGDVQKENRDALAGALARQHHHPLSGPVEIGQGPFQ